MEFKLFYEMGNFWIEAKLKDIFDLNIENEITNQSRIDGGRVFLDVDFDARPFLKSMKNRYPEVQIKIKEIKHCFVSINDKERYTKDLADLKLRLHNNYGI